MQMNVQNNVVIPHNSLTFGCNKTKGAYKILDTANFVTNLRNPATAPRNAYEFRMRLTNFFMEHLNFKAFLKSKKTINNNAQEILDEACYTRPLQAAKNAGISTQNADIERAYKTL